MSYTLSFSKKSIKDIAILKKTDKQAYRKLEQILIELTINPYTGTGKPEPLKYNYHGRRIFGNRTLRRQIKPLVYPLLI